MFSTWSKSSVFSRFSITTSVVFLRYQLYWAMMLPTEFQCRSPFMLLISISLKGSILGTAWRGKTRPASCLHCVCVCVHSWLWLQLRCAAQSLRWYVEWMEWRQVMLREEEHPTTEVPVKYLRVRPPSWCSFSYSYGTISLPWQGLFVFHSAAGFWSQALLWWWIHSHVPGEAAEVRLEGPSFNYRNTNGKHI